MSWRTPDTLRGFSFLIVLPAALVLASCGGSVDGDGVTGPSALAPSDESASAVTVTDSGKKKAAKQQVLLCHKGKDKSVPPSAVSGHLRHGDSLGSCSAPLACPCFSAGDIKANASLCSAPPLNECSTSDPSYLFLTCSPSGGGGGSTNVSVYISQGANGGYCSREDGSGMFEQNGLTAAEYQACVDALVGTGFC